MECPNIAGAPEQSRRTQRNSKRMFKNFFDTTQGVLHARQVLRELKRLQPPASLDSEARSAVKQREQFKAFLDRQARSFAGSNRLNVYQKARLGTRLMALLEEEGYPEAFRQQFSRDVVRLVALSSLPGT